MMTRKTSKRAAPARSQKRRFKLVVEGQLMIVDYMPNWMQDTGQFQFRSPFKPARRIPISHTGYRSHFADMAEVEAHESPEAYARALVVAAIRTALPEKTRAAEKTQPTFLSLLD